MLLEDSEMVAGAASADDGTRLIELGGERAAQALLAGGIGAIELTLRTQAATASATW